ncbi:MAG TPA: O-antigen ligase family protein [Burkholderiales bacterium]|nr:O-antigen ligase family protein [Burkholderiales bacterium]
MQTVAGASAEAAWLAILLIAPLVMNPVSARIYEAAKLTALAPLAALLAAAWLASWPRWRGVPGESRGALRLVLLALAAFYVCALISTCASQAPWTAFFGAYFRREGLAAWLIAGLVCAAMLCLLREPAQARRVVDALLLGCVAPCAYALLQRYGHVAGTAGAEQMAAPLLRPGGSLGNPIFLGDYLLLLMPLALVRVLAVPAGAAAWRGRAPWLVLLGLQLWVLALTQSRAPIGALLFTLWLFAVLLAGLTRSRLLLRAALGLLAAALLGLAAINLVPALAQAGTTVPGLSRFVFTQGVDLSTSSRLGIWEAGMQTLRHASAPRLMFGHGFDAAYVHYFPYLPSAVLQIEGAMQTIDRLHNETMELTASVGVAGLACYMLLIAVLLHAADRALDGGQVATRRRARFWLYALLPWPCGALGAWIAVAIGGAALAGVGFGLGAGAAWALLLAWRGVRLLRAPGADAPPAPRMIMIAALAATLPGFWLDAQIGLPVMSTRIVFFALAALLALLAAPDAPAKAGNPAPQEKGAWPYWGWAAGIVLASAMVACFPAPFGYVVVVPAFTGMAAQWLWLALPLLAAWAGQRAQPAAAGGRQFVLPLVWCLAPATLGYAVLGPLLQNLAPQRPEWVLGAPVLWVWVWLPVCCIGVAWNAVRQLSEAPAILIEPARSARRQAKPAGITAFAGERPARGRNGWVSAALAPVLLAATLYLVWCELRADILVKLAGWAQMRGDVSHALADVGDAAALVPGEAQYRFILGTRRLEQVAAQVQAARAAGGADPRQYLYLADELHAAEADLRAALLRLPDDPWSMLGLANVLQFEGMTAMRPVMGAGEGTAKAAEARRVFARAHALYPAQVTILRNWAQVEFDGGDAAAAYRLLDQIEVLWPQNELPYFERMQMARFAGDTALYEATLARAARTLPAAAMQALRAALGPTASTAPGS